MLLKKTNISAAKFEKNRNKKVKKDKEEPHLQLSNLPRIVKECIIEQLNTAEKLALRKCSYQFKTLVNASKLRIYRLSLQFSTRYVLVTRDTGDICTSSELEFERLDQGYSERYCRCKYNATCFYNKNHYIDKAIQKFLSVLRDPAVYVEEVSIDFWAGILHEKEINRLYSKITSALKSVNRQIPVRRIHIEIIHEPNSDYLLKILNCLQPKFLESLSVSKYRKVFEDNNTIDFSEIQKTEQWKKLKKLNVDGFMSELSFEQTKHFSTMDYKMNELQLELVKQIINKILEDDGLQFRRIKFNSIHRPAFLNFFSRFQKVSDSPDHPEFKTTRNNVTAHISLGPMFITLSKECN